MKASKRKLSLLFFILMMFFFYLPLLILVVFSFNEGKTINWTGFSLKWYKELFSNSRELWRAFENSLIISITSAVISTVIGTLGAIGLHWYNFRHKKYLQITSYIPLMMPDIIIGISLLIMFAGLQFKLGLFTIFLAHTTFNIPYVLFIVKSRLEEFDYALLEAAKDLGANEWQTLLKVILPVTMPGIIAAFLMAVSLSLDDFVITFFVTGPGAATLPLHIYSMIRFGVSPAINALAVLLILFTIILAVATRNLRKYQYR